MATKPEDLPSPEYLEEFYVKTAEFPAGFMTEYKPSLITAGADHQHLAEGFPVGKRFRSARVHRRENAYPRHLGHEAMADGRYRLYVFADAAHPASAESKVKELSDFLINDPVSPFVRYRAEGTDFDSLIEPLVVYQQKYTEFETTDVPAAFRPLVGKYQIEYWENIYCALPDEDIFDERQLCRDGVVVVVRPDQYVGAVLPISDHAALAAYFDGVFIEPTA